MHHTITHQHASSPPHFSQGHPSSHTSHLNALFHCFFCQNSSRSQKLAFSRGRSFHLFSGRRVFCAHFHFTHGQVAATRLCNRRGPRKYRLRNMRLSRCAARLRAMRANMVHCICAAAALPHTFFNLQIFFSNSYAPSWFVLLFLCFFFWGGGGGFLTLLLCAACWHSPADACIIT